MYIGFVMDFISAPVISGFCSAAAVTVIFAQFKTFLGMTFRGSSFAKVLPGLFKHWRSVRIWDTVLGFSFIIILMLLKVIPIWKEGLNYIAIMFFFLLGTFFYRILLLWRNGSRVRAVFITLMWIKRSGLCLRVAMRWPLSSVVS